MQPHEIDQPQDIVIIGVSARVSAANASTAIPALWQRFMANDPGSQLEARADDEHVYAVYCDYQSDYSAEYTMVLGVAVEPNAPVPDELRRVRLPYGRYAVFHTEGDPRDVIWRAWSHINGEWDQRARRRYIADAERYARASMTETHVSADILVGVD